MPLLRSAAAACLGALAAASTGSFAVSRASTAPVDIPTHAAPAPSDAGNANADESVRSVSEELSAITPLTQEERAKMAEEFAECEKMKARALATRRVSFLFENLAMIGALVPTPEKFVQCIPCDMAVGAVTVHDQHDNIGLIVCQNKGLKQEDIDTVIAHELVHVYDLARADIDSTDCDQIACMEVRASMLSGECSRSQEVGRGVISMLPQLGHLPVCVKRRALNSCALNPVCGGKEGGKEAIERVFARCFADRAPFYTIP